MEPISVILEQTIKNNAGALLNWLKASVSSKITNEILHYFNNEIIEYQVSKALYYANTKTLLHKDLVPFLKIYHPLVVKDVNNNVASIDEHCLLKMYQYNSCICILGRAGNGKTTIVQYIFLQSILSNFKIPVLINLRDVEIEDVKKESELKLKSNIIFKYVIAHLRFYNIADCIKIVIRLLRSGKFLLLLDGYDEINLQKKQTLNKHIFHFIIMFNKCAFLLTSRFFTGAESIIPFKNYSIEVLSEKDIEKFILKQFFDKIDIANQIIHTIYKEENKPYLEYLNNPLFLILFLNSYEIYPNLPPKRSRFFENVYEAVYEKHDNFSKLGFNRTRLVKLSKDDLEKVLFTFCFFSYMESIVQFSNSYLHKLNKSVEEYCGFLFSIQDFINELKINLNLLVEDGNTLKFIHRSFQEFFAAKFLIYLNDEEKKSLLIDLSATWQGSNLFFLTMIGELYPNEFLEHFLLGHITKYCQINKAAFERGFFDEDKYKKAIEDYEYLKVLINTNTEALRIYNNFLEINYHPSITDTLYYEEFHRTPMRKYAEESQILFTYKNQLQQLLVEYLSNQRTMNRKILHNFILNKQKPHSA